MIKFLSQCNCDKNFLVNPLGIIMTFHLELLSTKQFCVCGFISCSGVYTTDSLSRDSVLKVGQGLLIAAVCYVPHRLSRTPSSLLKH